MTQKKAAVIGTQQTQNSEPSRHAALEKINATRCQRSVVLESNASQAPVEGAMARKWGMIRNADCDDKDTSTNDMCNRPTGVCVFKLSNYQ